MHDARCSPPISQSADARDQSLSAAAREQPGGLVSVGRRSARRGKAGRQTDFSVDRLQRVPLVPRDGARELRGRNHRRSDERTVHQHQGRSGGASRSRPDLHERRAVDDPPRRLADVGVSDPRSEAVLRRDLLASGIADGDARLSGHRDQGSRSVDAAAGRTAAQRRRADRRRPAGGGSPGRGMRTERDAAAPGRAEADRHCRPAARRVRRRAEVPARDGCARAAARLETIRRRRRAGGRNPDTRQNGGGRDVRSSGRRFSPLFDRRPLAGSSLREDAVRQRAARPRVPRSLSGDRQSRVCPRRARDARLRAARDDPPGRRVLQHSGRRQRRG
jgi:hypothetical protein